MGVEVKGEVVAVRIRQCVCLCVSLCVWFAGNLQGSASDSGWDLCADGPPVLTVVVAVLSQRTDGGQREENSGDDFRMSWLRQSGGMGGSHVLEGSRGWHERGSGPDYRALQTGDSTSGAQPPGTVSPWRSENRGEAGSLCPV